LKEYDERQKRRQAKIGEVISTKCAKTINVEIKHMKYLPKYNAFLPRHRRIMAHDEEEKAKLGDIVRIVPCRPRSRTKRHILMDIIRRPKEADAIADVPAEANQS
jgi:small subunit ribosomal protein S17